MSSNTRNSLPTSVRQPAQPAGSSAPAPRGPNRSTKASQKLKVLPEEVEPLPVASAVKADGDANGDDDSDDDSAPEEEIEDDVQVYKQLAQIPAGSARRDAMRLTRKEKARLPRVTAYCTATSYRMEPLLEHLRARRSTHFTHPVKFDEAIYTPYSFPLPSNSASSSSALPPASPGRPGSSLNPANNQAIGEVVPTETLVDIEGGGLGAEKPEEVRKKKRPRFAIESEASGDEGDGNGRGVPQERRVKAEIFIFEYGTVVIWGMTVEQERRFLSSLRRFEVERLASDDVEMEDLNYYYANYSRIYNDVIALKKGSSYMTKLSLSHALAQSCKLSFFEAAVGSTIDETKDIPQGIAESGKIRLPKNEIMKQIGRLFLLRVNISLVSGSMVDSPELFWSFPDLEPLYLAFKTYLEVPQRLKVITGRVDVLQDMLRLLKETVNSAHGEGLEMIVIWLIVLEIILGLITIAVDLFA